jgi:carbonic anhydrase
MSAPTNHVPTHFWKQQSPINLTKAGSIFVKHTKSFLKFDYHDAPFAGRFEGDHGHANFVLDKPHSGNNLPMLTMGDVTAELIKIHLHTPSEHDIEGKDLGGEIHLIHRLASAVNGSELVVVGVFFREEVPGGKSKLSKGNEFFSFLAEKFRAKQDEHGEPRIQSIDPRPLIPKSPNSEKWYRYEGSLTSAPYSENVSWLVFNEPIDVLTEDFNTLKQEAHQPERSVQPINRRYVLRNFPLG